MSLMYWILHKIPTSFPINFVFSSCLHAVCMSVADSDGVTEMTSHLPLKGSKKTVSILTADIFMVYAFVGTNVMLNVKY